MRFNPLGKQFDIGGTVLNLGTAFQGVWNPDTGYLKGQAVSHQGGLYVCLVNHSGSEPPEATKWDDISHRGPTGLPGPRGNLLTTTAGSTLGGSRAVILDSSGQALYADAATPAHLGRVVGITQGAAETGQPVIIQLHGPWTEPSWTWDPALPVYAGNGGMLTQIMPVVGFAQIVGFPTVGNTLFINPQPPILLA